METLMPWRVRYGSMRAITTRLSGIAARCGGLTTWGRSFCGACKGLRKATPLRFDQSMLRFASDGRGVGKPKVDPLTGQRVHAVGGVAHQGKARAHIVLRMGGCERKVGALTIDLKVTEMISEGVVQGRGELRVGEVAQAPRLVIGSRPDQRGAAGVW